MHTMGKMPTHLLLHNRILVRKHWLTQWKLNKERDMTCLIDGLLVKLHATQVSFEPGTRTVVCPHCGSKNSHGYGSGHRICDQRVVGRRNSKSYLYQLANPGSLRWECPGYTVVDE